MNCKPGDIALCTAGDFAGAICEVVSAGQSFFYLATGRYMPGWNVEFPREMPWASMQPGWTENEGWYPDEWLRPLRGDAIEVGEVINLPEVA